MKLKKQGLFMFNLYIIDNLMLKYFVEAYTKSLPQHYSKLSTILSTHPNLIIHQSITALPSFHPLNINLSISPQSTSIPKGVNLFMLSASQSFSNIQLVGANTQDKSTVQNFFEQKKNIYEILQNQQIRGLFRILIQIYANQQVISKGQMPLHYYSSLLLNQAYPDPKNLLNNVAYKLGLSFDLKKYEKQIKSFHLLNILRSNQNTVNKLYQILSNNFIRSAQPQQFSNLLKLVRSQLRSVNQNATIQIQGNNTQNTKIQALSPILSSLKQSFNPNCTIVGKYFTHLRQSFYCLQTLRVIKPNQILTIPMKRGVNNYDKFIRYGYKQILKNPQNPDNQYILIINLQDPSIPEVQQILMTGDIDRKKQLLTQNRLKLKNLIKITKSGTIKKQDLKMLRILYGIQNNQQLQAQQSQIDSKIYNFIGKFVKGSLERHQIQSKNKTEIDKSLDQQVIRSIRIIEQGQIQILKNFMNVYSKICKK